MAHTGAAPATELTTAHVSTSNRSHHLEALPTPAGFVHSEGMDPVSGDERKELEKALRVSRRAVPIQSAWAILGVVVLWVFYRFLGLPAWAALVLGFFAVFGAVSDAINIPYIYRKLNRLEPPPAASSGNPQSKNRS